MAKNWCLLLFEVDFFRGMKKGHVKWNANVSFRFKRDSTNAANKMQCNMVLSMFTFHLQAGDFLTSLSRLTAFCGSRHPEQHYFAKHCHSFHKAELLLTLSNMSSNVSCWKACQSRSEIRIKNRGPVQVL